MLYEVITLEDAPFLEDDEDEEEDTPPPPSDKPVTLETAEPPKPNKLKELLGNKKILISGAGRITSYNVCYTKLLRIPSDIRLTSVGNVGLK